MSSVDINAYSDAIIGMAVSTEQLIDGSKAIGDRSIVELIFNSYAIGASMHGLSPGDIIENSINMTRIYSSKICDSIKIAKTLERILLRNMISYCPRIMCEGKFSAAGVCGIHSEETDIAVGMLDGNFHGSSGFLKISDPSAFVWNLNEDPWPTLDHKIWSLRDAGFDITFDNILGGIYEAGVVGKHLLKEQKGFSEALQDLMVNGDFTINHILGSNDIIDISRYSDAAVMGLCRYLLKHDDIALEFGVSDEIFSASEYFQKIVCRSFDYKPKVLDMLIGRGGQIGVDEFMIFGFGSRELERLGYVADPEVKRYALGRDFDL